MKAILLSIKPYWAKKIYSGEKLVEVRKSTPSPMRVPYSPESPAPVYLYESGTGLITGMF